LKLEKVVVVSKFGSKISEDAAKNVTEKLLVKKITAYTISPVSVEGSKSDRNSRRNKKYENRFSNYIRRRWNNTSSF